MTATNHVPKIRQQSQKKEQLRSLLREIEHDLEPISPAEALDLYLEDKKREYQPSTVGSHRSRLGFFISWCEDQGIANMNNLTARALHEYRVWRREDLNVVSEKTQLDTLRIFIEWCETIDGVSPGLFLKIDSPTIPDGENARDRALKSERASEILDHLETYEYASVEHVLWLILANTGMRMGAVHGLDVNDYHPHGDPPYLEIEHRPETGTSIKNKVSGERSVALPRNVCEVVDDYLEVQRPDVKDEAGREPLISSTFGRMAKSTIRKYIYKWTRPCMISGECPHDREIDDCEAAESQDDASKCPSSLTPHPIRRGYITSLLRAGTPVQVVSERCNVSPRIIDQHYDVRSEGDKMRQRHEVLEEVQGDRSFYA